MEAEREYQLLLMWFEDIVRRDRDNHLCLEAWTAPFLTNEVEHNVLVLWLPFLVI